MKIVGVTGGIGCGKSLVCDYLEELGAYVIDGDEVARDVTFAGKPALSEIISSFGWELLLQDGSLDRSSLSRIVFNDKAKLLKLNSITHKYITGEIESIIKAVCNEGKHEVLVVEAALIHKSDIIRLLDTLIMVTSDTKTRIERVIERNKMTFDEVMQIINAQPTEAEYLKYATVIIRNDGNLDALREKTGQIYNKLLRGKV